MTERLGSIKSESDITVELSTRSAVRLFDGIQKSSNQRAVIGLLGFAKLVRTLGGAVSKDDPYADYYYFKIENAIEEMKHDLNEIKKEIEDFISANTPKALKLPNVLNPNPKVAPVKMSSKLSFKLLNLILQVDEIVLSVLKANHVGILSNAEKIKTINECERKVRGVMHIVFDYKHTGVTRDDIAAGNQVAKRAIEIMGALDQEYLTGETRSSDAPSLPTKRMKTISKKTEDEKSDEIDELVNELTTKKGAAA